jgi:glycosyltransferase involved in cell wall biosynthesis
MRECTATDKPLVTIVMAVCNPRMDWFKEQLVSLNNQSYENLELLAIDDCSSEISFDEISETIKACITNIPYKLSRNSENLGSTKTFEKLTALAGGDYIAYCDQDDIWYSDKIETLLGCFINENVNLAFSDVQIIDESGIITADSITEFRTRHKLYEGRGLSGKLIIQNFVNGLHDADKA